MAERGQGLPSDGGLYGPWADERPVDPASCIASQALSNGAQRTGIHHILSHSVSPPQGGRANSKADRLAGIDQTQPCWLGGGKGLSCKGSICLPSSLVMTIRLVPFFDLFMHVLAETILPAYS